MLLATPRSPATPGPTFEPAMKPRSSTPLCSAASGILLRATEIRREAIFERLIRIRKRMLRCIPGSFPSALPPVFAGGQSSSRLCAWLPPTLQDHLAVSGKITTIGNMITRNTFRKKTPCFLGVGANGFRRANCLTLLNAEHSRNFLFVPANFRVAPAICRMHFPLSTRSAPASRDCCATLLVSRRQLTLKADSLG